MAVRLATVVFWVTLLALAAEGLSQLADRHGTLAVAALFIVLSGCLWRADQR